MMLPLRTRMKVAVSDASDRADFDPASMRRLSGDLIGALDTLEEDARPTPVLPRATGSAPEDEPRLTAQDLRMPSAATTASCAALDDALAFIEVSNAIAALESTAPYPIARVPYGIEIPGRAARPSFLVGLGESFVGTIAPVLTVASTLLRMARALLAGRRGASAAVPSAGPGATQRAAPLWVHHRSGSSARW